MHPEHPKTDPETRTLQSTPTPLLPPDCFRAGLWLLPFLLGLLAAAGCATPEARVRRHPDRFANLPAETRERVLEGRIEMGDSKDAVYLAKGRADRITTRRTTTGTTETWVYTRVVSPDPFVRVPGHRRYGVFWGSEWYDVGPALGYHEEDLLRIEFESGRVTAIEELVR